jgi:hypothetical protein
MRKVIAQIKQEKSASKKYRRAEIFINSWDTGFGWSAGAFVSFEDIIDAAEYSLYEITHDQETEAAAIDIVENWLKEHSKGLVI